MTAPSQALPDAVGLAVAPPLPSRPLTEPESLRLLVSFAVKVVQAMVSGSLEAIAGVTRTDGVGLVLIAGLGGVFAEALHDISTFPLPVGRTFVETELAKGSPGRGRTSSRWKHPGSFSAFVDLPMCLQTIDINPVIVGGGGAITVDALVVPVS